jgi:N6-adenosine-specific RNA methylase IME4
MLYNVIYADPPWKFKVFSSKGLGRSAEAWYDCMDLEDIKNLDVKQYAAKDCVLLMWVTDPFLEHGLELIKHWGFKYKTVGFYWAKLNPNFNYGLPDNNQNWAMGTGYWTRANPEQCLLATIGHPKRINADVRKLVISARREHSRKPDEVYVSIERLCKGPYLELFARTRRDGWDSLGHEVDVGPLRQRRWDSNKSLPRAFAPDQYSLLEDFGIDDGINIFEDL